MTDTASLLLLAALAVLAVAAVWRARAFERRFEQQQQAIAQAQRRIAEQDATLRAFEQRRLELLANVSHDLRTPLASMQGYIELLLVRHGSLPPAEERNYLQTAARQGERLTRLVGDLFDLTRLEAGELPMSPEDFAPAELAHDLVQKFAPAASQRGLQIEAACQGADRLRVHADLGLVSRVLEGLVENALRHTPEGGRVALEVQADGALGRIGVRDTGCGIAADQLPGIFERYERASRVRGAGRDEHAGLGLAIARRIVELHGSHLDVSSTEGAGTRVSFALPLAQHDTPPRRLAA